MTDLAKAGFLIAGRIRLAVQTKARATFPWRDAVYFRTYGFEYGTEDYTHIAEQMVSRGELERRELTRLKNNDRVIQYRWIPRQGLDNY